MNRRLLSSVVLALAVTAPGFALAGGHVDIKAVSLPREVAVGKAVPVSFTVTYPNGDPCPAAKPVVRLRSGRTQREFPAVATREPGAYLASVKLPRQGEWSVLVDAGYCGNTCKLSPVTAVAAVASR